jgi:hypothetical protein
MKRIDTGENINSLLFVGQMQYSLWILCVRKQTFPQPRMVSALRLSTSICLDCMNVAISGAT